MLNNFIYAQTKDLFLDKLNAGEILDEAIVFIEDTKEIWNHGHYFAGESIDPELFAEIQASVSEMEVKIEDLYKATDWIYLESPVVGNQKLYDILNSDYEPTTELDNEMATSKAIVSLINQTY